MSGGCRLTRWRQYAGVEASTFAAVIGVSTEGLEEIESRGLAVDHADRLALKIAFNDCFKIPAILARSALPSAEEAEVLKSMSHAYAQSLARWQ